MYLSFVRLQAKRHGEIEDMLGSLMGVHCKHMPHPRPPHRQVSQKLISLASSALQQHIPRLSDLIDPTVASCHTVIVYCPFSSAQT